MKRGWKIFWIVCGALASLGVVLCIVSLVLGVTMDQIRIRAGEGVGFHGLLKFEAGLEDDMEKTYEGITRIDADVYAGTVKILPGEGTDVSVETKEISRRLNLEIRQEGEELKIDTDEHVWGINDDGEGLILIYIPRERMLDQATVELKAGTLYIEDLQAQELSVDTGAAEAVLENVRAKEADIACGVGSVTGSGCFSEAAEIEVGVGSLEFTLTGAEEDYNYALNVGVGEVEIGGSRYSGVGTGKEIDNKAARSISVDCGTGSAKIIFDERLQKTWDAGGV